MTIHRHSALAFILASLLACCLFARPAVAQATRPAGPRVVLVTASGGFVHDVVKPTDGDSVVSHTMTSIVEKQLGGTITRVSDAADLTADLLDPAKTDVIAFYTTGDLPEDVPALLQKYVEAGGAMLGMHCATDTAP